MRYLALTLLFATSLSAQTVDQLIDQQMPSLMATYTQLHAAPELSMQEKKTSELVASQLRAMGFDVTYRFGQYVEPNATCYGVVAVMQNGAGPTVPVRSDRDAVAGGE